MAMVRVTKSPLLLCVAAWAGVGLLLSLSVPSTAFTTGSMNTSSSILDTRTTSARYTSNSGIAASSAAFSSTASFNTTSSIVDTKTTSARYTSEFIPVEGSSTSGLTSSEGLCVASNTGCLSDADCSTCLTLSTRQGNSGTSCQSRYPDHFNSSSTICQQVAAIYCCYYEDKSTAEGCLDNLHTAQYWNCIVTGLGLNCIVEDMPCYGGILTETSSPTGVPLVTDSPTASPSAFDDSEAPTLSPSLTISPDGHSSDTTSAPTQAPSSSPSDGATTFPTVGEPDDITGDLNGVSRLTAGALAPWRLALFAWGLGIWLSSTLVHARC